MRRTVRRIAILSAITTAFVTLPAGAASAQGAEVPEPSSFTSMFTSTTSPGMVVNAEGMPAPGPDGATGTWNYRLNSGMEIICYGITVSGISVNYQSPARTATHIRTAAGGVPEPRRRR